jgi:hypothetical protein
MLIHVSKIQRRKIEMDDLQTVKKEMLNEQDGL